MDAQSRSQATGPLEGLRVLEMSTMMAGPYAATLFGDLGADVATSGPSATESDRPS
jgi:crotonobetainyl-CoA:carnitine CoA-transferase CaiB-like acyl-CoA transferase